MTTVATLAARKINQNTVVDPKIEYSRIWSFRTQEQMDLWINEMQGQISDGMWENSNGTDWLWKGYDIFTVNPEKPTSLVCLGSWGWQRRRTSFGMSKDLIDCIEERIYTRNGFEYGDIRSLKAAWKEIQEAIKNATESSYGSALYVEFVEKPRKLEKARTASQEQATTEYVKENYSDLINVKEHYWESKVKGIYFSMMYKGTKIKVHDYSNMSLVVPVDKVRATVDFLTGTLGIGAN